MPCFAITQHISISFSPSGHIGLDQLHPHACAHQDHSDGVPQEDPPGLLQSPSPEQATFCAIPHLGPCSFKRYPDPRPRFHPERSQLIRPSPRRCCPSIHLCFGVSSNKTETQDSPRIRQGDRRQRFTARRCDLQGLCALDPRYLSIDTLRPCNKKLSRSVLDPL